MIATDADIDALEMRANIAFAQVLAGHGSLDIISEVDAVAPEEFFDSLACPPRFYFASTPEKLAKKVRRAETPQSVNERASRACLMNDAELRAVVVEAVASFQSMLHTSPSYRHVLKAATWMHRPFFDEAVRRARGMAS